MRRAVPAGVLYALVTVTGCTHHTVEVEPVEIAPIYLTMDLNIRIQRELDEFFDFEDPEAPAAEAGVPQADGAEQGAENGGR